MDGRQVKATLKQILAYLNKKGVFYLHHDNGLFAEFVFSLAFQHIRESSHLREKQKIPRFYQNLVNFPYFYLIVLLKTNFPDLADALTRNILIM